MINRRDFLKRTTLSSAGIVIPSVFVSSNNNEGIGADLIRSRVKYNLMEDVFKYRKIDAHAHVEFLEERQQQNMDLAGRLGINKMVVSRPITSGQGRPSDFISYNDLVLKTMRKYPNQVLGQLTLNVQYQKESLAEITRCVDQGMVSVKVYTQVKISDPLFYPIIEKLIDLKMILHSHSHCQLGVAGYRMKYDTKIKPNTSIPEDFIEVTKRYPEVMLQYAHLGGGGDWEYACKAFRDYPNIYVDTSGSNNAAQMVDFAVKYLGENRVFFASDNCYYQSVGKVLSADLTNAQKNKIFFDNYNNVLKKSGRGY